MARVRDLAGPQFLTEPQDQMAESGVCVFVPLSASACSQNRHSRHEEHHTDGLVKNFATIEEGHRDLRIITRVAAFIAGNSILCHFVPTDQTSDLCTYVPTESLVLLLGSLLCPLNEPFAEGVHTW